MRPHWIIQYLFDSLTIGLALVFYNFIPFGEVYYAGNYDIKWEGTYTIKSLNFLYLFYLLASIISTYRKVKKENLRIINLYTSFKSGNFPSFFQHFRVMLLKFFFIPLMYPSMLWAAEQFWASLSNWASYSDFITYFNNVIYKSIILLIGLLALLYYTSGYIVESKRLNNEIISTDNTWMGWVICLICYLPFYAFLTIWLPMFTNDFGYYKNAEITFIFRCIILAFALLKIWSIAILGWKCSNLTNRGIVVSGPYKWIRHPHYLSKLGAWWIGLIPFVLNSYWVIAPMIFWTLVYVLRASTEEQHLSADQAYQNYCSNVRWRFIPYIY